MGGRSIIYLIAFMDDATRFITGLKMLFDKKAEITARVLQRVLEGVPPGHKHLNIGRIKLHSSMTLI
jgi:hypothetical protein